MKVCEKVQKKGITTYNEVADELVAEFSSADNHMSPNDSVSVAPSERSFSTLQSDLVASSLVPFRRSTSTTRRTSGGACTTR